jgi:hypothetical protein
MLHVHLQSLIIGFKLELNLGYAIDPMHVLPSQDVVQTIGLTEHANFNISLAIVTAT